MPTDGRSDPPADGDDGPVDGDEPTDEEVVRTAARAAQGLVFSRYRQSDVRDLDVTVTFEDGVLDVDVYLDAPDEPDPEQVAEDAALAARSAVDDLFDGA